MTEEQKRAVENHLTDEFTTLECTRCGESTWMIKEDLYSLRAVDPAELQEKSDGDIAIGLLTVVMVCSNCKNIEQISITDMEDFPTEDEPVDRQPLNEDVPEEQEQG